MLICPKCEVINYLDPYMFWDFKGKTKCAGCDTVYAIEKKNGQLVSGPTEAPGPADLLPGFAETKDFVPIEGEGKIRPSPQARPDVLCKPKHVRVNIRGNPISGAPLTPDELIGSRPRFIAEQSFPK